MRNTCRPMGRFFCLLMVIAAAGVWSLRMQAAPQMSSPALTQVVDTVYRADGMAAKGTVLISWPAFTTADGKAVAAGSLSVQLGDGGAFSASLAPNTGAQPAGVYYKVVYQLAGQAPSTEYWVVGATSTTSIGAVRAKLVPPTMAAQFMTRDQVESEYVHTDGDQTVSGTKTFTTVNAQNINGALNAAAYPGADMGAKVNAAIAACAGNNNGQQCEVQIPQGVFNHAVTINLKYGVVLRCSGQETTTLSYTGSGTAINFAAAGAQIHNCGVTLGPNAQYGLDMSGHHGIADAVYLQGGGAATTLLRIHSDINMVSKVRMWGILGTGIQIDHATDTYLTDINVYGVPGNTTSQTLVVDTLTGGLQVENFSGGYSGRHGLVVRNTMPDHAAGGPTWLFFRNFVADCSAGGDGWLFDSSLGSAQVGATFLDSWSAGAGKDCRTNTVVTAGAAGIRISGGRGIHIGGGSKIRANEGSGIVIDSSNAGNIQIENSFIYGNNNQNAGSAQGIDVTAWVDGLSIIGNTIGNYSYEPGYQQYGIKISQGGAANLILTNNNLSGNTAGAILNPASPAQYVQIGNTNTGGGAPPNSVLLGDVGTYAPGSSNPAVWMVAQHGATANFKFGYGVNCHWSGSAWQFDSDGANNGGACLFGQGSNGQLDLYTVPTNAPASGQTLTPTQLESFKRLHFDPTGAAQFFANLSVAGTLTAQGATFTGTTTVPTPVNPTDAATKAYVDAVAGGGGGNLASPPAIGSTTPNAGTFTTLTAQSVNGTLNAPSFPGTDACAQINSAIAALPPAGGVVDATGFTAAQISSGCTTTVNAGVAAVTLRFGAGTWKLGGNPGISVTAPKITIECPKASEGDLYNTVAATLLSNAPYPLIADTVQSFHSTDGLTVRNCYLDGNGIGTFGLFLPYGNSGHLENVYTRNFTSVGQFVLGGQWTMVAASSGGNGGDGLVLGFDNAVDGNAQFAGNQGSAVHVVSGGNVLHGIGTYKNRLHGIYLDGRAVGDWTATTTYVQQSFIRPTTNNAGSFVYFTQKAGTTGSGRPSFCQAPGCTFSDGSVTWVNAGTGYGYIAVSIFENSWWNFLESANSTSNGFQAPAGFDADDIRIEGTVAHPAFQNNVSAAMVRQSEANDTPAHGIHLLNTNYATINNVQWLGAGYSNNPDLGGLRFEASKGNTVNGVNCWFSYSNCIQLVSANNSTFTGLNVVNNGLASTPMAGTYALSIDASSVANTINDLNVRDDRGPAYSRGVADAGTQTMIGNYRKSNLASNPDSYSTGYVHEVSTAGAPVYTAGSGQAFTWKSGATQTGLLDSSGNWTISGDLNVRDIPGHEYFVSKYASIQAAIDAAYNNGTVQGGAMVIDDRTAPYSGPGFIVRDSVTLRLAATTYTITGTVTNNNGISNVTAGIISMPGSHIVGSGTSANHGTNVNAGAGLNADVIATSTVGTGSGATAQWWHWGSIENFHMNGNKASQTAGSCINVENMGETAVLRALEVGNCYSDDIRLEGNFATQSEISNITVNSAGQYGVNLDKFQGVGVLRGLSGDSNATSIIRFNGSQSATLTVLGLKSEEEISGHDPLITMDMPADGSQPALYIVGGYTYGRAGLHDVIKIINGKPGAAPFVTVNNFYVDGNFVNAVNDTVNNRTFAASNMNKVPFSYLPTGSYQSGQAFTFAPSTFIQGGTSVLTEIFGSNTDGSSMIAAQGNGDGTSYFTGGLKIGIPNRAQFGQPPEMMARMGTRFLGAGNGYDLNTWVFVPIWKSGDSSNRWIGEPNQRWPEVYATDVNATTATIGTLNVTNCTGCTSSSGSGLLNYQTNTATLVGNSTDKTIYTYTLPGGKMAAGTGVHCYLKAQRVSGSGAITYKWKFGATTVAYASTTSASTTVSSDAEFYNNPGSTTAQIMNLSELHTGVGIASTGLFNTVAAENTGNEVAISVTFNGASTEQIKGVTFKCMAEQ